MEIKKVSEILNESGNVREILPQMVGISNNSRLTMELANALVEKLSDKEIRDFKLWMKLIETNIQMEKNKKKYW